MKFKLTKFQLKYGSVQSLPGPRLLNNFLQKRLLFAKNDHLQLKKDYLFAKKDYLQVKKDYLQAKTDYLQVKKRLTSK